MNPLDRRRFLQKTGLAAGLASGAVLAPASFGRAIALADNHPRTGFETSNGASWTTHAQELTFLQQVADASKRVRLEEVGRTRQNRPLHLVTIGDPGPADPTAALSGPITMFVGSQHGNEPAGREACLTLLRDLAFTTDPVLLRQLKDQTILVVPSANPDGRAANTRANSQNVDINRDHLALTTIEARTIASVILQYNPDLVLDLHEYGPGTPVLYDDDILYLWPRNLNVDGAVRDLSRTLALEYIEKDCEAAGFTADEYGIDRVEIPETPATGPYPSRIDVQQTAGDEDEGICRNLMGLRHSLGILVESAVSMNVAQNGAGEANDNAAVQRRRVASHRAAVSATLRFMREQGEVAKRATDLAPLRKAREGAERSAPVYFGGADNEPPTAAQTVFPPPAGYRVKAADVSKVETVFDLHGIRSKPGPDGTLDVSMGQAAEPVIPLLLDDRGARNIVVATPLDS